MLNIEFAPLLEVFDSVLVRPSSVSGGLQRGFSYFLQRAGRGLTV
jgi:hypothetical protein